MTTFFRAALIAALLVPASAQAQAAPDWGNLAKYRDSDRALAATADPRRIVFMGDSITEGWDHDKRGFFADPHHVNRGISGQTTPQMLVRFRQDVIALKPRAVVILAGTNDIAGNTGPASNEEIEGNIASMAELARANGIRVVLATLVPAARYPWAPAADPATRISQVNDWIRAYARRRGIATVDFYRALATPERGLPADLASDGVHPNAKGYAIMERTIATVLARVAR
ncbi:SGNH/GDSL hydrolase family protein [Sphingomonas sp. ASV193]|uniref:SGNH/GDSL hydrolase family protein n=1 Tax=Sphingomonas sp. ASV193 TaxID=3144405 RepID=UPI0032E8A934